MRQTGWNGPGRGKAFNALRNKNQYFIWLSDDQIRPAISIHISRSKSMARPRKRYRDGLLESRITNSQPDGKPRSTFDNRQILFTVSVEIADHGGTAGTLQDTHITKRAATGVRVQRDGQKREQQNHEQDGLHRSVFL